jgi:hypothetical protein
VSEGAEIRPVIPEALVGRRLKVYTDHAAKVGREYGIRLAVKRRLAR